MVERNGYFKNVIKYKKAVFSSHLAEQERIFRGLFSSS